MTRRSIIKWITVILVLGGLIGGGVWLTVYITGDAAIGRIEYGKEYYLTGLRPKTFFTDDGSDINLVPHSGSYFKVNEDKKTGEFVFTEANTAIKFVVSNYKASRDGTAFTIEYIKDDKIIILDAFSDDTAITFKALVTYNVSVTAEEPNNISQISHDATVMVFTRGGK